MPILRTLRENGARVTVIGKHETDPCHAYADHSLFVDYSNAENLLSACTEGNFDFIVPTCNDYSYVAAARVAEKMGFPGFDSPETTSVLHTKNHFRRFCSEVGVPAPRIIGQLKEGGDNQLDAFAGPVLIKPVDSFSGRGIQIVENMDDIGQVAKRAFGQSRRRTAVVEQFVKGALHSHTAFIADGQVVWHDYVDEFCEVYPYQVDRSTYPSRLTPEMRRRVHACITKIVSVLSICDGLLHTQFIASENEFWIIECMRRCPGDLYGHHFQLALGQDYEAQYVAGFLGKSPRPPERPQPTAAIERSVITVDREEAFFGVSLRTGIATVLYIPLKTSGETLRAAPFDKAGIVFFIRALDTSVETAGQNVRGLNYERTVFPEGRINHVANKD